MAIHTAKRTIKLWAGLLVLLVCSLSSLAKNTVVVIPLGESPTTPSKTVFITTGTHTGNFGVRSVPMQSVSQKQMPWAQKQQVLIGHGLIQVLWLAWEMNDRSTKA